MPVKEVNIGTLVAAQNPVTLVWRIGIVVDIQNKYPTMILETNRYTVKWFDNGETISNFSYARVSMLTEHYDSGIFDEVNTKPFDG